MATLWWTNKKLLKMAIEIVDFPIKNGGSFHCYVSSPEATLNNHENTPMVLQYGGLMMLNDSIWNIPTINGIEYGFTIWLWLT